MTRESSSSQLDNPTPPEPRRNYAQAIQDDPYSWFVHQFYSAFDKVNTLQMSMSEGEWDTISMAEAVIRHNDPAAPGVRRMEKRGRKRS